MKPNSTEIIFVVDRSGSMADIAADMRGGFDTFIEEQKKLPGECRVTLTRFDNEFEVVYEAKPLAEVGPLELIPRGGTALLEAIGRAVDKAGARFKAMAEEERPSRVLVVIITDGEENSSGHEYSKDRIFNLIKQQRDEWKWEFIFLGTSQDSIKVAQSYGMSAANAAVFNKADLGSAKAVMRGVSKAAGTYRSASVAQHRAGGMSLNVQEEYATSLAEEQDAAAGVVVSSTTSSSDGGNTP